MYWISTSFDSYLKIFSQYCKSLQMAGLSVSMAPDDDFESDDDVE